MIEQRNELPAPLIVALYHISSGIDMKKKAVLH